MRSSLQLISKPLSYCGTDLHRRGLGYGTP